MTQEVVQAQAAAVKKCQCPTCSEPVKPATLENFYAHKTTRDRLSHYCKPCHRAQMREKARVRYYEVVKPFKGHKDRVFKTRPAMPTPPKSEKIPGIEN